MALILTGTFGSFAGALQPPTNEQLQRYQDDGTLVLRVANAYRLGNHRIAPHLVRNLGARFPSASTMNAGFPTYLSSLGNQRVFALLIEFSDHRAQIGASQIDQGLFGDGHSSRYPYESIRNYYRRSSYGKLDISGSTLGWYRTSYPRSRVERTASGREGLIIEAINHFNRQGHDFRQYDNDGDGFIEYFLVFYTGPSDEWADFWWAYFQPFTSSSFTVDGKRLSSYSWQAEGRAPFSPRVAIHETGHALGLPDYYDYDDAAGVAGVGPPGGLGGLDMMDHNWGDHNCFSKLLLGWIDPETANAGTNQLSLRPSDSAADATLLMHGDPPFDPYAEYFMAQYRRRQGNDSGIPGDGLMIWHVDARIGAVRGFINNNSNTDHKLLRLMEADGLEEIERGRQADSGDFYRQGDMLDSETTPSSHRYDGAPTNLRIDSISTPGQTVAFRADLGSGCAIHCDATAPVTAWPGLPARFEASAALSNCEGSVSFDWWIDGAIHHTNTFEHTFAAPGSRPWSLQTSLGDASCPRQGSVLVCRDVRCWQWRAEQAMSHPRAGHSATVLSDGRVLVVGGGGPPEVFDPTTGMWSPTGPAANSFWTTATVLLADGRVLATGSAPLDPVNAEIYDPATDTWSLTGQLALGRVVHNAIRLPDGRVLVAGGCSFDQHGACSIHALQAEVFDPATEVWSPAGSVGEWMVIPCLTVLESGQVLLNGNYTSKIYDPASNTWRPAGTLAHPRAYHATVPLPDGRLMALGGYTTRVTEIFHPGSETWSPGPPMLEQRIAPAVAVLSTGHILVAGGTSRVGTVSRAAEMFDPAVGTWTPAAFMGEPRYAHTASRLPNGSVLLTGGTASPGTGHRTDWIPSPTAERFIEPEPTQPAPRRPRRRIRPGVLGRLN